jgi:hypothetical protein
MQAQLPFWQLHGSSNEALLGALSTLVGSGRRLLAELVAHLAEVEERRLHLDLGHGSMFAYCTGRLGFSEDEAYRRIEVSRLARQYPGIFPRLATGDLSLSVSVLLKPFIQRSNADELIDLVSRQTVARAKELLAARFPRPDAASSIRKLPVRHHEADEAAREFDEQAQLTSSALSSALVAPQPAPPCNAAKDQPNVVAPALTLDEPRKAPLAPATTSVRAPRRHTRPLAEPLSEGRYRIQLTADTQLKNKLELARDLMRHVQPDGDLGPILARALDLLIESIMRRRFGARKNPPSEHPRTKVTRSTDAPSSPPHPSTTKPDSHPRTIPRPARRTVVERDGMQCTWCGPDGTRCTARAWLEQDHVQPWARGGCSHSENLRLLCHAHNRRAAEREYGRRYIARRIARARAHAAVSERLPGQPAPQPRATSPARAH